ncbi:YesL family protein [Metabacillus bambusae]|uniref:YesL family protein n=1 Tax=Metabacillus bambusae TaxID=2795218 RepID=A0ABS3N557_9BACI|nr:YesL family protein [Metabacillus bambusae]MBO1513422.1 YesL family protein [Metabacillus bambusae]
MSHLFNLDGRLFRFLSRVIDLVILNFIFLLFCMPIITIGASITALYSVLIKMVRDEDKYVVKSFILSFNKNFIQSTIVWFIMLAAGFLLLANFLLLGSLSGVPKLFFVSMLIMFGFVYLCILLFIFPYMARYEDTIKKSLLNSLLIGVSNYLYLLLLLSLSVIPVIFTFSSSIGFLSGLYFGTFGGFAFLSFINSYIFNKAFSRYET